jgi:hypothetical protein
MVCVPGPGGTNFPDHHWPQAANKDSIWSRFEVTSKLQVSLFKRHAASAKHLEAVAKLAGRPPPDPLAQAPSVEDFTAVLSVVRSGKASHRQGMPGTAGNKQTCTLRGAFAIFGGPSCRHWRAFYERVFELATV